jgi:hypothetical protein
MKKDVQSTKMHFGKLFWVTSIVAIVLFLALLSFKKTNLPGSQEEAVGSSSAVTVIPGINPAPSPSPYPENFPKLSISIDQIVTFSDRYFMKGTLHQSDTTNGTVESVDVSKMSLTDSTGKQIPVEPLDFGINGSASTGLDFSFYTHEKGAPGMLTLTIPSAVFHLVQDQISSRNFEVDFGDNPQEKQEWFLNKDFELAGRNVRLLSVKALMKDGEPFLEFTMMGDSDLRGALIFDTSIQSFSGNSFFTFFQNGQVITQLKYANALPKGKHQFAFHSVSFSVQGNWQYRFDPAVIDKSPSTANSELHDACFLNENWRNRESLSTEIPAHLSGTLLVDNTFTGLDSLFTATIDLKGGEKQNVLPWQPVTFSPDGTMIIYYDWQTHSAHITNLYGGETKEYPWSKGPSNRISWLRNTDLIAYDSDDGIYISHVDGSGLYKVSGTDSETLLSGWLPDGQHLLVSRARYNKPMLLQILDIKSGEAKDLFSFSSSYITAAIPSPDGKKVLFEDTVTGTQQTGIFIASLNGSERHLIASFWRMLIGSYTWSPDGKWVIISVTDIEHRDEITDFLINIDSCETVRLSSLDWAVRAWGIKP